MPPTGRMTEELAARRVRHAVQAGKAWNEIDIQFLKQQGKLDELCEIINSPEFTIQANSVAESEVQIPVDAVPPGVARARRTHESDSADNVNCDRSDSSPTTRSPKVPEAPLRPALSAINEGEMAMS